MTVWLMIKIVKEICKLFILVRLGAVNPSATSLPGLPMRVSLISDSLPVYTGQRGLKREWLCMDKISYLWEGVGWGGEMWLRLGQLENICTFCICCHMTCSARSSSFVKCANEPAACMRLFRILHANMCKNRCVLFPPEGTIAPVLV